MSEDEVSFKLPFLKKEKLTPDTYSFYFKRTGEERDFTPGQYFEIKLDIKNPDERGDARVFTCSSSPTEKEHLIFTTKIIESSFKNTLHDLRIGAMVQLDGPWDDLSIDVVDKSPKVFLAGGIGVTPFHSMVKYATDKRLEIPMILFVSWVSTEEMVWDDFFRNANNHLENFTYVPTVTHEEVLENWDGETGRINDEMIKKYVHNTKTPKYYFAGPPAMVKVLRETVQSLGVSGDNVIAEEFEGY